MINSLKKTVLILEQISEWTGRLTAWLIPLMMGIIVYEVTTLYFFNTSVIMLRELQWHLFALIFLLGAAYTFKYDEHVRVDIFYQRVDVKTRAWIDFLGSLLWLIPFCLLIVYSAYPFVKESFIHLESSSDPGGLPYRFLLKSAIPIGFSLLILQAIAHTLRNLLIILGSPLEK